MPSYCSKTQSAILNLMLSVEACHQIIEDRHPDFIRMILPPAVTIAESGEVSVLVCNNLMQQHLWAEEHFDSGDMESLKFETLQVRLDSALPDHCDEAHRRSPQDPCAMRKGIRCRPAHVLPGNGRQATSRSRLP
jgi:hypothetical protein